MADENISTPTNLGQQDSRFGVNREQDNSVQMVELDDEQRPIIWTPTFIALFALVIVVGLSMTTVLIQGWLNGHYSDKAVLLAYMPLLFCLWVASFIKTHSTWVRAGALFGCLWSLFMAGSLWFGLLAVDSQATSVVQMHIAANSALLGTFICLSLAYTPFRLWDTWFFRLLPFFTIIILGAIYLHNVKDADVFQRVENASIVLLLYLGSMVWWLRPSCWRKQPGPAFLFGGAPLIMLFLIIPDVAGSEQIFFFEQIFLLCILLGAMRILQGELRYPQTISIH